MIVYNLGCDAGHRFEGWFASASEFDTQQRSGMLECPACGAKEVSRLLSAPRLNLTSAGMPEPASEGTAVAPAADPESAARTRMVAAQAAFYRHMRQMLERSEDMGDGFAEEARRIHYNETPERQIHGVATLEETAELLDEGIAVLPLPFSVKRKDQLN